VGQNCCKYVKRVVKEGLAVNLLLLEVPGGATYLSTAVVAYFLLVSVKDAAAILNVSLLFSVMPQVKGYYPAYAPLYVKGLGKREGRRVKVM